jgi:putative phosphoribosyl transferase
MTHVIEDRTTAGHDLARRLDRYRGRPDVLVLALPRGGVPVAAEIARALQAPMDLMMVRKLGVPGHEELAMGAIALGGSRFVNADVVGALGLRHEEIERVAQREQTELDRRARVYRGERPPPELQGRCVILVDDGIATGATVHAAITAIRSQQPSRIVLAVPVAPRATLRELASVADEVVCLSSPEPFVAISRWYERFPQLSDAEVLRLLDEHRAQPAASPQRITSPDAAPPSEEAVRITAETATLEGTLAVPTGARGIVVFAHGSGSSRHSDRNRRVAAVLNDAGFATLLFDLLTGSEQRIDELGGSLRFDIELLTRRLDGALDWLRARADTQSWPIGLFGASTGAAAALGVAAARAQQVAAVVSRGGRPDLAAASLPLVSAPTLLIVGGFDDAVIGLNRNAASALRCEHRLEIVPGATHLFEEPGKLEQVAQLARDWFERHLAGAPQAPADGPA